MFKSSLKICFVFLVLLFNIKSFSLLVAEEEPKIEGSTDVSEVIAKDGPSVEEEVEDVYVVEEQKIDETDKVTSIDETYEVSESVESIQDKPEIIQSNVEDDLSKIELHEHGDSLVQDDDSAEKLKEVLSKAKDIGIDIKNISDVLREIRNKFRVKYQDEVDRKLDELLQRVGFVSGIQTGKDRFKLLHSAVKSEYENEWVKIKSKVDEIDLLEDKVLEKLKKLDNKYEIVVKLLLESRKINLEVFSVSDSNKVEGFLEKLQTKFQDVKKVEKEVINVLEKELDSLISQIAENFKKVEDDFRILEEKGSDLDEYENALEKAEKAIGNQLPKWRIVIENIVDRSLDYSSLIVMKTKKSWNYFYLKITDFFKKFISDVREKSREIRKENSESEVITEKLES